LFAGKIKQFQGDGRIPPRSSGIIAITKFSMAKKQFGAWAELPGDQTPEYAAPEQASPN
jgi:hypothetical protein